MTYKIPLMKPVMNREMIETASYVAQNEKLVLGESVFKFEEEFADFIGVRYAKAVGSGTDGLTLSLMSLGAEKEIITTPASFIATSNSILHAGARPVFTDIDRNYNLDAGKISSSLSKETRGIVPVHLYGYPANMREINELAKENGLFVVEDACQAHGATYYGSKCGSMGDVGVFSFYPSKNMTVGGDGGMVTTNNEEIAGKVESLRHAGRSPGSNYLHDQVGFTSRLNTMNAAIGRVQLKELPRWNARRREAARKYNKLLRDLGEIVLPPKETGSIKPSYHMYVIRCYERNGLREFLNENGIETGVHYPIPIHLQPPYMKMGFKEGDFRYAEKLSREALSIPMHPELSNDDIAYVSDKIHEFFGAR